MLKAQEIREIIQLIDQSSITEFNYEAEGTSVSMKKNSGNVTISQEKLPVEQESKTVIEQPQVKVEKVEQASVAQEVSNDKSNYDYEVVSPMVGTFYISSSPDSDPYVSVGSSVEPDSIVCIVEAMKLFNEIEAEVSGEIVEIVAQNGELVEYGQPLFRVKKK